MIFISYSHDDRAAVTDMVVVLRRAGVKVWFDETAIAGGDSFVQRIDRGLRSAEACVVCIGPGPMGSFARRELDVAIALAADRTDFRIVPVLLPGVDPSLLGSQLPSLFLASLSWVDLRDGVKDERAADDLIAAVCGRAPELDLDVGPAETTCPYRGLDYFDEEDAPYYFGWEAEQQAILTSLDRDHCVFVIGPSGCGKSSFVRAGLLPQLASALTGGVQSWLKVVVRPGADATRALAASLAPPLGLQPSSVLREVRSSPDALALTVEAFLASADRRTGIALVIDQLEHVFALNSEESQNQFLGNLVPALDAVGPRFLLLCTLRADYYGHVAARPPLADAASHKQYLMGPMTESGLRSAITRPAEVVGLEFQYGLVDTILADVAAQRGALPLLEHALLETWQRRRANRLTLGAYLESGGVKGAIAQRAEATYQRVVQALGEQDAGLIQQVFVRLARVGDGPEDTSQPQPRAVLTGLGEAATVDRILDVFTEDRLLSGNRASTSQAATVEVAHEALIRGWPRYRGWLQSDREGLQLRQRVSDVTADWEIAGRDDSLLYRGSQLERLETWSQANPGALVEAEREFLDASIELRAAERQREAARIAQEARARVLRRLVAVLVTAALVVTVAAGVAVWQWREASQQRERARALQEAALGNAQQTDHPDTALLLSADAYRRDVNDGTRYQLANALTHEGVPYQFVPLGLSSVAMGALPRNADDVQVAVEEESAGRLFVVKGPTHRPVADPKLDSSVRISALAVSGDGSTAVYGAADSVFVVDTASAAARPLPPAEETVDLVGISPDGTTVAAIDRANVLHLWSSDGSNHLTTDLPYVTSALLVDGPTSVVTSSDKGEVDRWELLDEQPAQPVRFDGQETAVTVLDTTPSGNLLAAAGTDGQVVVWDVLTRRERAVWPVGTEVTALRFDPNGRNLWAATADGEIRSFYVDGKHEEGSPLQARPGEGAQATGRWLDLSVTPIAVSGLRDDGTLVRWRARPESRLARPLRPAQASGEMLALAGTTDGVVTGVASDGTVHRWPEASPEAAESVVDPGSGALFAAALTPDGDVAAFLGVDGSVSVHQLGQASPPSPAPAIEQAQAVAIARDGTRLAIGSGTGAVALVEVGRDGLRLASNRPLFSSGVTALAFSPDGDRLASADDAGTVRVTNPADTSAGPLELRGHTHGVYAMSFSNDGRLLATGGDDQRVILWDATSGRQLWTNLDHREKVRGFAFDDAASTLASVDEAGALLVSRLSDGRPIYPPLQHADALVAIGALSSKPSSFAVAHGTAVDVWDLDERGWVKVACSIVGREVTVREWADTSEQGQPPRICAKAAAGVS